MANQIAAYFEAYPRSEALDGIAGHIRNFWTPRMRTAAQRVYRGRAPRACRPLVTAAIAPKAKSQDPEATAL